MAEADFEGAERHVAKDKAGRQGPIWIVETGFSPLYSHYWISGLSLWQQQNELQWSRLEQTMITIVL